MTTPCVQWEGGTYATGYGRVYVPGTGYGKKDARELLAHRWAYEQEVGPIPPDMQVHHRCENRMCVNVDHLELLYIDEHAGGRGHGKLTRESAAEIKRMLAAGSRSYLVARRFGISQQQVCNIRKGRCWAA